MNEQKNSVPEQSEPKQVTEAQEQQTAAEQERQSPEQEQNTAEQIDYKSELEKANSRIALLELEVELSKITRDFKIIEGCENEVVSKAHELIKLGVAKNLLDAAIMLSHSLPDKITCQEGVKYIRMSTSPSLSGTPSTKTYEESDFTKCLSSKKPSIKM